LTNNKNNINSLDYMIQNYDKVFRENKVSFGEVICTLEPFEISLINILSSFPIIYPRSYSISSNSNVDKNILEIIFSFSHQTIKRKLPDNLPFEKEIVFKPFCTSFLKKVALDADIVFSNVKNCFSFPNEIINNQNPLIFICNGTGISPFLGYLKELYYLMLTKENFVLPEIRILTGFRSDAKDESETIEEENIKQTIKILNNSQNKEKIKYYRCLSQCAEKEEEEIGIWRNCRLNSDYVQDLILQHREDVYNLVFNQNSYIMICGDINKLFGECMNNLAETLVFFEKDMSIEKGKDILKEFNQQGKIIIEKWN